MSIISDRIKSLVTSCYNWQLMADRHQRDKRISMKADDEDVIEYARSLVSLVDERKARHKPVFGVDWTHWAWQNVDSDNYGYCFCQRRRPEWRPDWPTSGRWVRVKIMEVK